MKTIVLALLSITVGAIIHDLIFYFVTRPMIKGLLKRELEKEDPVFAARLAAWKGGAK